MKKLLLICSIFLLGNQFINAQSLVAGDIAFIGFHQDDPDGFTFITLTDISAGQVIYFTDHSWSSTDNTWHNNTGDAHYSWTVPAGGVPIGTIVSVTESLVVDDLLTASLGVIAIQGGGSFSLISSGDVLIAYQSTSGAQPAVANATFLAAIYTEDNYAHNTGCDGLQGWFNSTGSCASNPTYPPNGSNASGIPNGLTDGVNAMHLYPSGVFESGSDNDNGRYTGTLNGDAATIRAAINDRTNWAMEDNLGLDITATYFNSNTTVNVTPTVTCTDPDVPSITRSTNNICPGATVTLGWAGANLNDASKWHIYTGSCGVTELTNQSTSSLNVNPLVTTTYYIRGEDGAGCVDESTGNCGQITVTVDQTASSITSATASTNNVCASTSVDLTANGVSAGSGATLTWYTGAGGTGSNLGGSNPLNVTPATTTTYYARLDGTCNAVETSITVTVDKTASSITSATASTNNVCASTSVDLTANGVSAGSGATLTWYTGAGGTGSNLGGSNPLNVTPATTTTYYARLDGTCNAVETSITITVFLPLNVNVTQSGALLTADESGATYQWLDCPGMTPISGANNQSYTPTINGDYAVVVTKSGCSDTSTCYTVASLGIMGNNFSNKLLLYPNPTDGNFSIDLGNNYQSTTITITNLNGKIIQSKTYKDSQLLNLKLEEPTGVYLLIIESGNKKAVIRLIKE